jgi:hypothetical protein
MEPKDNFTNRYFKPEMIKSQMDLINQPTGTDAIAEGFQKYSKLPASNAYAELDNMTMSAIGDGMQAASNNKRQEQIDPLLKMTGEINARASYMEAQMQEEQQETMQVQQFVKSQSYAFSELAKASTSGDTTASNNIARGILQQYKNTSGDPIIGDFDHYHDGIIYYTNTETGEKGGLSVSQLISQSGKEGMQSLGADYPLIMSAFSTGFKGQYENTQELQRLERDKLQSNIDNTDAQTGVYNSQAMKNKNEIANPVLNKEQEIQQKLNSDILKDRAAKNYTAVEEKIVPRIEASENMLGIYEGIQGTLENSPDLVGSDWKTQVWRGVAVNLGLSPDIDYQKLKSVEFEKTLRPILGAQFGEREGERILGKFISLDNNPESIKTFLKQEMPKLVRNIVKDKQKVEFYSKESHGNLYDAALHTNLDEESEKYLAGRKGNNLPPSANKQTGAQNQNNTVTMTNSNGESFQVPSELVEAALNDQDEPLTLVQ